MKDTWDYFLSLPVSDITGKSMDVCIILDGDWAEFGVWEGASADAMLSTLRTNTNLYLFDSFEGLPENFEDMHPKGHFACSVPEFNDKRVHIIKGLFSDTLPSWEHKEPLAYIHMDCDLYSSVKTVFDNIGDKMAKDTVIFFDDYYNYHGWENHSYKAFMEFNRPFEYVGRGTRQAVVRLLA